MAKTLLRCMIFISILQTASISRPSNTSLEQKIKRFASSKITADVSKLSPGDRKALDKLIDASKLMDSIYLRQVWSGNIATLTRLRGDKSAEGKERLKYFNMNMGPWSK